MKEQNESLLGEPAALKVIKRIFNGGLQRLIVENMFFTGDERALKIAAGTCAFREDHRFPMCRTKRELDAAEAMLQIRNGGKRISEPSNILPAPPKPCRLRRGVFGFVMFRLSFHHFVNAALVMREMYRVLRTGGRLFLADMAARQESLRGRADFYKRVRGSS